MTPDNEFERLRRELLDTHALSMTCGNIQAAQITLYSQYQQLALDGVRGFSKHLRLAEAQWFSQNGEDGILLFLLARIGLEHDVSTRSVEIGAGNGWENNTINLAAHRGFEALLVDPSWALRNLGSPLMATYPSMAVRPPTVLDAFAEPDNINEILDGAGFAGGIGVLSIDIDGNDFWLWRAIRVADPLIVVAELNIQLGADVAWTIPYTRGFDYWGGEPSGHIGASVPALDKLARSRGYVFAGSDRLHVNGFWVKRGLIPELGDGVEIGTVWHEPRARQSAEFFRTVRHDMDWVEVTDAVVAGYEIAAPYPLVTAGP